MADVTPNWRAEQLKLKIGIQNLKTQLLRSELEIVEAKGRIETAKTNIKATHEAIADSDKRLRGLVKEHGDLAKETTEDG